MSYLDSFSCLASHSSYEHSFVANPRNSSRIPKGYTYHILGSLSQSLELSSFFNIKRNAAIRKYHGSLILELYVFITVYLSYHLYIPRCILCFHIQKNVSFFTCFLYSIKSNEVLLTIQHVICLSILIRKQQLTNCGQFVELNLHFHFNRRETESCTDNIQQNRVRYYNFQYNVILLE